ncbi:MAG: DNA-binding protein [Clostridiales bacterium]|nr:DNA-binding protein [Clostridiales bacterium]
MKDIVRRAFLLDYYGPLLTEKQREAYEWYFQQDLSLGEIGEAVGVSRGAIYDLVSRTDEKLERFERALGLIAADEKQRESREALALRFTRWKQAHGDNLDDEAKRELDELIGRLDE